ncbi:MAG: terminase, partial [Deltaproteobacteria bacterium]|nr:terminase [Candidatus Tharpellaceae bacterium]
TAPVHIGLDANVGKMAGVVVMKGEGDSKQAFAVSEFFNVLDTPAMINAIHARFPNRMIIVYPDSSMGSRKSVDSSKTDIKLLRNAGFRINAPRKNGAVKDRVGSMNVLFKNGENERNFFVNSTTCPNFVEALEKQVYDDNGVPVKDNITDHLLDAAGYAIVRLWGVAKPTTSVVRMRF